MSLHNGSQPELSRNNLSYMKNLYQICHLLTYLISKMKIDFSLDKHMSFNNHFKR